MELSFSKLLVCFAILILILVLLGCSCTSKSSTPTGGKRDENEKEEDLEGGSAGCEEEEIKEATNLDDTAKVQCGPENISKQIRANDLAVKRRAAEIAGCGENIPFEAGNTEELNSTGMLPLAGGRGLDLVGTQQHIKME